MPSGRAVEGTQAPRPRAGHWWERRTVDEGRWGRPRRGRAAPLRRGLARRALRRERVHGRERSCRFAALPPGPPAPCPVWGQRTNARRTVRHRRASRALERRRRDNEELSRDAPRADRVRSLRVTNRPPSAGEGSGEVGAVVCWHPSSLRTEGRVEFVGGPRAASSVLGSWGLRSWGVYALAPCDRARLRHSRRAGGRSVRLHVKRGLGARARPARRPSARRPMAARRASGGPPAEAPPRSVRRANSRIGWTDATRTRRAVPCEVDPCGPATRSRASAVGASERRRLWDPARRRRSLRVGHVVARAEARRPFGDLRSSTRDVGGALICGAPPGRRVPERARWVSRARGAARRRRARVWSPRKGAV